MQLPTFFVIGAAKSGTTSLHEYLAVHPEVAMTTNKEPMLFQRMDWERRIAGYDDLFPERRAVRGESSTGYTAYPWSPEIPDRIRARVPDAKLVYLVREPVSRTLSHYAQNLWDGLPVRPFDELMADLEAEDNIPVWTSRYATQLERWRERFPPENFLVLDQRRLLEDRDGTMRDVFAFLGVDPSFTSPRWEAEHNTAVSHRKPNRLGARMRPLLGVPGLDRLLTYEVPRPELTPEQRERLLALLAPEAQRLREMAGLELAGWPV